jgi:hypothetical protein
MSHHVTSQTSDLLALPAELRNRIYELALAAEKPLHYIGSPEGLKSVVLAEQGSRSAFNQLENVCQELARDTADLEIQYNDILIVGTPAIMPTERLKEMRLRLGSRAEWLRNIVIKPSRIGQLLPKGLTPYLHDISDISPLRAPSIKETLENSRQYCQNHPGATIKFLAPHFEYHVNNRTLEGALLYCLCLSKCFRHKEHANILPSAWQSAMQIAWAALPPGHVPMPSNLIFYPFDEDFQADVEAFIGKLWRTADLPKPEAARAMQQVYDWIMHGI